MSARRYGWIPDLPDKRDCCYLPPAKMRGMRLPPVVDLRETCPPVYDQGELGSCTAQAICGVFERELLVRFKHAFTPSRLFLYYNERVRLGTVKEDSGATLRDGMKCAAKQGICPESVWRYMPECFTWKPSPSCYEIAQEFQVLAYRRLAQKVWQMMTCLADGHPFVFGFSVYESFESPSVAKAGVVPMPGPGEEFLGGHAVAAVGYDQIAKCFVVRNSWGRKWGDSGHCYMPFEYLEDRNLADDFWTLTCVEPASVKDPV